MSNNEAEKLREYIGYDPKTGSLYWKKNKGTRAKKGNEVGSLNSEGYRTFILDGKTYAAHRVAVFLETGSWPAGEVDHRNYVRHDNRWKNLLDGSRSDNQRNREKADCDNKTGFLGVSKKGKRFRATLTWNKRQIHLGTFDTPQQAHSAYLAARQKRA